MDPSDPSRRPLPGCFPKPQRKLARGPAAGNLSSRMRSRRQYMIVVMPEETQKVLGVAKHPLITTGSGKLEIWNLSLKAE